MNEDKVVSEFMQQNDSDFMTSFYAMRNNRKSIAFARNTRQLKDNKILSKFVSKSVNRNSSLVQNFQSNFRLNESIAIERGGGGSLLQRQAMRPD